jgi:Family of unknown function (DUF6263)
MGRIMEKMFKTIPQDPASAAALNAIKSGLTDEAMKQMFGQGFSHFPDRPLKVGDTWSRDSTFSNPILGKQTTSTAATLTGVDGQLAKIAFKLIVKFDPSGAAANPMGMTVKLGDNSGDGEVVFDLAKGQHQRSTTRLAMDFSMSGSGPDGAALTMQTTSKSVVTVEIVQ